MKNIIDVMLNRVSHITGKDWIAVMLNRVSHITGSSARNFGNTECTAAGENVTDILTLFSKDRKKTNKRERARNNKR